MNEVKYVRMAEILPVIREKLQHEGEVIFNITGNSMAPLLHHRKDQICLMKARAGLLKKYDFPIFIRESTGAFVAHRVVSVNRDGSYNMCGDNQWNIERNVKPEQIIGIVTGMWRNGRYISVQSKGYRLYCRIWCFFYPLRYLYLRGQSGVRKLLRLRICK